ncbi:MAG: pyridoxamine 5'-phosphate oxidase [Sphingomonas sp.]|uniref:pyridoxamine 5'-phosphate oxidase n=1 Tax=Sphingomonas sp. TaxID=28214 RepID=UPI001ACCD026|nr:pyridoxamine 5'-phosphate oxidase [Sphingomonas sp.]MBN8817012.1 pyridoxamine 5'-phosphate oxidase [Sphingomonas sp.]
MADDPFALFDAWFAEAQASEPNDPNAMALATAGEVGNPSVRMVLLKGQGPDGFVFYTNLDSHKGNDLRENQQVALLFHWKSLRRQIRIEGNVEPVTDAEADAYFATRGRDSQLGAWASDQSRSLDSREIFEARFEEVKARFDGQDVPRPPNWSGFRVIPENIEFWQDRAHRLHERRFFVAQNDGLWAEWLLYP